MNLRPVVMVAQSTKMVQPKSIFFVVLTILPLLIVADPCVTPNGHQGDCRQLTQCPQLNAYFEGPLTTQELTLLRKSHCGFQGRHPKVCCPIGSSAVPETPNVAASSDLLPEATSCGRHTSPKIVGGEVTALDEFPWMALLQFKFDNVTPTFECGGTLINKRYVLTAAHCISPFLVGVRLGEYNTDTDPDCVKSRFGEDCAPTVQDFGVEKTIVYEDYDTNNPNFYHDIALIRLNKDAVFNDFVQPICLPLAIEESNKTYEGEHLTVSGWGLTEKELKSNVKRKVQVPVRELSFCIKWYGNRNVRLNLKDGQICAGGAKGRDSCRGDSGGPLMTFKADKTKDIHFFLIGIVSFGPNPCGQDNLPAVYTRVAKYTHWITKNLKP